MSRLKRTGAEDAPQAKRSRTEGAPMANGAAANGHAAGEIDEDLHSRQLAVYGRESMRRMAAAQVLVCGLGGLGVEVAKNIILAGVKAVVLHDPAPVALRDLGDQFYLREEDVGQGRAEACRARLQELNTSVRVTAASGPLDQALLSQFQAVVATDLPLAEARRVDAFCHAHGIAFVRGELRGVFASVFCDFGPGFTVLDTDGEQPHTGIVASITPCGTGTLVTCVEDERLEFQDGDLVSFSEVVGLEALNDRKPRRVKNCRPQSFEIEESVEGGVYERGGIVTQVKEPKELHFKTLEASLREPGELLLTDFSKLERPAQLHAAFQALDAFQEKEGRLPAPHHQADADRLLELAAGLAQQAAEKVEVDEKVLRALAYTAHGNLNPMAAVFGGVLGQEVVKALSGKFMPIFQWLYFDSMESLADELPLPAAEVAQQDTRYDSQVAVFGQSMQARLAGLKVFLVGAGALGCEFLKNFAMMGVGTAPPGLITVTDDDSIEKSNLSRQFLFRDRDIGSAKSTAAAAAAQALNPKARIRALQNRVSPNTEGVFDDAFWGDLDVVVNALDNVTARLYVDSRCVYFGKPLLESGTLGPKCNTQMVLPGLTENYGASRDPPEKEAPMCTLHSFPHNIDHCLTFARSEFEGALEKGPQEANAYLDDPAKFVRTVRETTDAAAREQLSRVASILAKERCRDFGDCVAWARHFFQHHFHDRIAQLVFTFPSDAVTSSGALFWSAPKRFPHALPFDAADPAHATFVQAAALLRAQVFGVEAPAWAQSAPKVGQAAAAVEVAAFVPQQGVVIETDPKATKPAEAAGLEADDALVAALVAELEEAKGALPEGYRLAPVLFEKDDDTNHHMALIQGLANMRARNYDIEEVDFLRAKLIAGKIIPAIATATAFATGLVCLELVKVLQAKPLEAFRNTFANLAVPLVAMAEPVPPKAFTFRDLTWTLWDRRGPLCLWVIEGDITGQELLDWCEAKGLSVYSVSAGSAMVYSMFMPKHKERLKQRLSEVVPAVTKAPLPPERDVFDVIVGCEDEEGNDHDIPIVSIKYK